MANNQAAPLEAEAVNYRKPKRPTKTRIAQKPYAVVMLAWAPEVYGDEFDSPADRDFEPFQLLERAEMYFEANVIWAKEDWAKAGDMTHMILLVGETGADKLKIVKMEIIGGKAAWRVAVREGYEAHPEAIFTKTKRERILEERKVNQGAAVKQAAGAPVKRAAKKAGAIQPERRVRKVRNDAAPARQGAVKPRIRNQNQKGSK